MTGATRDVIALDDRHIAIALAYRGRGDAAGLITVFVGGDDTYSNFDVHLTVEVAHTLLASLAVALAPPVPS